MPKFTVLIPTHDHVDTLIRSIYSVQLQTVQDFELFVVGDGAPPRTDEIMRDVCSRDSRITYFRNPKGESNGEAHRAAALQQANGHSVCYLGDDDLWLPYHLETMERLLANSDFVHTVQMDVGPNETISGHAGNLHLASCRKRMLTTKWNYFGPSCVGHTLEAYRRLPHGWRPKPAGVYSDLHMWRQWLTQRWCRFHSEPRPTMLRFPSPGRVGWTTEIRCQEMDRWLKKIQRPGFEQFIEYKLLFDWQQRAESMRDFALAAENFAISHSDAMAERYFDRAVEAERNAYEYEASVKYADWLIKGGRSPRAIAVLRNAVARYPYSLLLHRRLLNAFVGTGQYHVALEHLQETRCSQPQLSDEIDMLIRFVISRQLESGAVDDGV